MRDNTVYQTVLSNLMHGKENRSNVIDLLSGYSDPELAVPATALVLSDQSKKMIDQKIPDELIIGTSAFLVEDLFMLGVAAGLWENPGEEEIKNIYQDTVQDYIQRGLHDKTPVRRHKATWGK